MRYYSIIITEPRTGALIKPKSSSVKQQDFTWSSYVNGQTIPAALNIELDAPISPYGEPNGSVFLRIWGISIADISQAANLNNKDIKIYAGMAPGLPLSNFRQAGLILRGQIFQAFGNWVGTDQTLDMQILPAAGEISKPKNIVFDWRAGSTLASAIEATLLTAYPEYAVDINISDELKRPNTQPGFYYTLTEFAQFIKEYTNGFMGPWYKGVDIVLHDKTFKVFDGQQDIPAKQIDFKDLVGQPTWIAPGEIQFKCPMRADLRVGTRIRMPKALVLNSANALSNNVNQRATFQGVFDIMSVHHFGNYRQPDAASWATVINAVTTPVAPTNGQ